MLEDLVLHVKEETITAPMVITQMMKLQQISGGFIIDEQGDTNELVGIEKNEKIKLIKEIVDELDSKVIIFAFYKKSISNLAKAFIGTKCALLTGGQKEDTQAAEKLFFNEGEAKVLIAQLTAGKYGHTLLGTEEMPCHTSIFYENNYDLDARVQAEARNHRHGQHYPVTYVDMVGTNLDRKVIDALQRKQNLATSIIDAVRG
jgi:SNF2 family DNA or RNA helicase